MECIKMTVNELLKEIAKNKLLPEIAGSLGDGTYNLVNDKNGFESSPIRCQNCDYMACILLVVEGGRAVSLLNTSSGSCAKEG